MTADNLTIDALDRTDESAVVDLCTCTGETLERLESDDPALISYVRTARRELD